MEIYLVRHTETVCEKGVCYGQADVEIQTPFETVFKAIVKQLPTDFELFSSPLQRCRILATFIQKYAAIPQIKHDDRLLEMNFGDWELQPWNAIDEAVLEPWMADFVSVRVPNGESFLDLHDRVLSFIETELTHPSQKAIVIVAHAGVIRSILCAYSNLPLKDAFQNKVDFGQVIRLEI
ncbi:alpha-ribazole phosphatase [Flavobacterium sp. GNP001]